MGHVGFRFGRYVEVSSDLAWYVMFSFVLAGVVRSVLLCYVRLGSVLAGELWDGTFGWVQFWQVRWVWLGFVMLCCVVFGFGR